MSNKTYSFDLRQSSKWGELKSGKLTVQIRAVADNCISSDISSINFYKYDYSKSSQNLFISAAQYQIKDKELRIL